MPDKNLSDDELMQELDKLSKYENDLKTSLGDLRSKYVDRKPDGWHKVGVIGVDAGLCWVGDPCYVLHKDDDKPKDIGADWHGFYNKLDDRMVPLMQQFSYDGGHKGLGVCVSTGCGDGIYPVFAKVKDGMVSELKVVFLDEDGLENED